MTKLLWHSNAPWSPTGYGMQTGLFLPYLKEHYELRCSSFYGLEGAPISWEDILVVPGLGGEYGNGVLSEHARRFFDGDLRGGIVVTLMDVWVLEPAMAAGMNMACWCPVDHTPAPPNVVDFFVRSGAVPIAMSRFGERELGRLDPLYVPHGVDTEVYRPLSRTQARGESFPADAFVVGMVAANKGRPARKGFSQALGAFAKFAERHENACLYLHTTMDPAIGGGENLGNLIEALGLPFERVRQADQYTMMHSPYPPDAMARIYSAMDVLMNPSFGEGFGVPIIEAQACGVPAIVTDSTAMSEVCGAGWKVGHHPYWSGLSSWQTIPRIEEIEAALEECYAMTDEAREELSVQARKHALQYDVRRVFDEHMLPALRVCEQRFAAREPVRIPARKLAVAA